jgi:hypothetical protein
MRNPRFQESPYSCTRVSGCFVGLHPLKPGQGSETTVYPSHRNMIPAAHGAQPMLVALGGSLISAFPHSRTRTSAFDIADDQLPREGMGRSLRSHQKRDHGQLSAVARHQFCPSPLLARRHSRCRHVEEVNFDSIKKRESDFSLAGSQNSKLGS